MKDETINDSKIIMQILLCNSPFNYDEIYFFNLIVIFFPASDIQLAAYRILISLYSLGTTNSSVVERYN